MSKELDDVNCKIACNFLGIVLSQARVYSICEEGFGSVDTKHRPDFERHSEQQVVGRCKGHL